MELPELIIEPVLRGGCPLPELATPLLNIFPAELCTGNIFQNHCATPQSREKREYLAKLLRVGYDEYNSAFLVRNPAGSSAVDWASTCLTQSGFTTLEMEDRIFILILFMLKTWTWYQCIYGKKMCAESGQYCSRVLNCVLSFVACQLDGTTGAPMSKSGCVASLSYTENSLYIAYQLCSNCSNVPTRIDSILLYVSPNCIARLLSCFSRVLAKCDESRLSRIFACPQTTALARDWLALSSRDAVLSKFCLNQFGRCQ